MHARTYVRNGISSVCIRRSLDRWTERWTDGQVVERHGASGMRVGVAEMNGPPPASQRLAAAFRPSRPRRSERDPRAKVRKTYDTRGFAATAGGELFSPARQGLFVACRLLSGLRPGVSSNCSSMFSGCSFPRRGTGDRRCPEGQCGVPEVMRDCRRLRGVITCRRGTNVAMAPRPQTQEVDQAKAPLETGSFCKAVSVHVHDSCQYLVLPHRLSSQQGNAALEPSPRMEKQHGRCPPDLHPR